MRKAFALSSAAVAAAAFPLLTISAASAAPVSYQADLGALNGSGASGTGMVTFDGDQATLTIKTSGLLKGSPHAQHFHIGAQGTCPTSAADKDGDGIVSTPEAMDNYGGIKASLTTSGDTSPDSALAVDRFPTYDDGNYSRTFTVGSDVVDGFKNGTAVLVIHGIDKDGSGKYDGDAKSPLDASLPIEATAPAACGVFTTAQMGTVPNGAANTGGGSTAGVENEAALGLGALALTGAAAVGAVAYRRRQADSPS